MPKIDAPTLAEHREKQLAVLLSAAHDAFIERGFADTTFADVAGRAGLARSSVYEYFSSKDDLLVAVCRAEMPVMVERLQRAMARARSPREKVATWIRVQLSMVAAGEHRLGAIMAAVEVTGDLRSDIDGLHDDLTGPLVEALAGMGWKHEHLTAALVQGIVEAGASRILAGESSRVVTRQAVNLALDGLG
jgi:AcrR family transcriptional regulator